VADHKIETCAFCGRQILPRESRVAPINLSKKGEPLWLIIK